MKQTLVVVQVRAGCELRDLRSGEVIVTAVPPDGSSGKIEFRSMERPRIGDRFLVTIAPAPVAGVA